MVKAPEGRSMVAEGMCVCFKAPKGRDSLVVLSRSTKYEVRFSRGNAVHGWQRPFDYVTN